MSAARVGIALPARNVLRYVQNCLTTLDAQTYPCSVYVVDDASDDGTYEFLAARPGWYRQLARNSERLGWPASLNRAAQLAIDDGCTAVWTMNADDFLRLDCIAQAVAAMAGRDWTVVNAQQIGGENVVQANRHNATLADFRVWPPLTNYALIREDIWTEVGGYSSDVTPPGSFGSAEDWDFWIKVFKAGYTNYAVVTDPVYYYLMHPGQLHEGRAAIHSQTLDLLRAKHPDVFTEENR